MYGLSKSICSADGKDNGQRHGDDRRADSSGCNHDDDTDDGGQRGVPSGVPLRSKSSGSDEPSFPSLKIPTTKKELVEKGETSVAAENDRELCYGAARIGGAATETDRKLSGAARPDGAVAATHTHQSLKKIPKIPLGGPLPRRAQYIIDSDSSLEVPQKRPVKNTTEDTGKKQGITSSGNDSSRELQSEDIEIYEETTRNTITAIRPSGVEPPCLIRTQEASFNISPGAVAVPGPGAQHYSSNETVGSVTTDQRGSLPAVGTVSGDHSEILLSAVLVSNDDEGRDSSGAPASNMDLPYAEARAVPGRRRTIVTVVALLLVGAVIGIVFAIVTPGVGGAASAPQFGASPSPTVTPTSILFVAILLDGDPEETAWKVVCGLQTLFIVPYETYKGQDYRLVGGTNPVGYGQECELTIDDLGGNGIDGGTYELRILMDSNDTVGTLLTMGSTIFNNSATIPFTTEVATAAPTSPLMPTALPLSPAPTTEPFFAPSAEPLSPAPTDEPLFVPSAEPHPPAPTFTTVPTTQSTPVPITTSPAPTSALAECGIDCCSEAFAAFQDCTIANCPIDADIICNLNLVDADSCGEIEQSCQFFNSCCNNMCGEEVEGLLAACALGVCYGSVDCSAPAPPTDAPPTVAPGQAPAPDFEECDEATAAFTQCVVENCPEHADVVCDPNLADGDTCADVEEACQEFTTCCSFQCGDHVEAILATCALGVCSGIDCGGADPSPPTPPTTAPPFIESCYFKLISADGDFDRRIDDNEYVVLVDLMAEVNFPTGTEFGEIPDSLQQTFTELACLCRNVLGASIECCIGDNAMISNEGAAPGETPTNEQEVYLSTVCFSLKTAIENALEETFSPSVAP